MDFNDKNTKDIYNALYGEIENITRNTPQNHDKKKLYYISAEFLTGKMLVNTLINAGLYDKAEESLEKLNTSLREIEKEEHEPSLGNGGLGRLAACFMDSMANLSLNAEGMGLNYHFGLFRQEFIDNKQVEKPNPWIHKNVFLKKTPLTYNVELGNLTLRANTWQMDILGRSGKVNKLTLFDVESVDESIVKNGIEFDKTDYAKNLTLFLYPDDSDENGTSYTGILDNDSYYYIGLNHGAIIPFEMRGQYKPVVPYSWLTEHYEINKDFFKDTPQNNYL